MIISTPLVTAEPKELFKKLKDKFSGDYTVKLCGLGPQGSVIVKKSTLVGLQLTPIGSEIIVDRVFPSFGSSILAFILATVGILNIPYSPTINVSWIKLEKEVGAFLS